MSARHHPRIPSLGLEALLANYALFPHEASIHRIQATQQVRLVELAAGEVLPVLGRNTLPVLLCAAFADLSVELLRVHDAGMSP